VPQNQIKIQKGCGEDHSNTSINTTLIFHFYIFTIYLFTLLFIFWTLSWISYILEGGPAFSCELSHVRWRELHPWLHIVVALDQCGLGCLFNRDNILHGISS